MTAIRSNNVAQCLEPDVSFMRGRLPNEKNYEILPVSGQAHLYIQQPVRENNVYFFCFIINFLQSFLVQGDQYFFSVEADAAQQLMWLFDHLIDLSEIFIVMDHMVS